MTPLAELARRVADLERRLANTVRFGTVASAAAKPPRITVRYGEDAVTAPIRWVAAAGKDRAWRLPSEGEQVVLLCPGGELAMAVALPGVYRDMFPAPVASEATHAMAYRDGAILSYDAEAHELEAVLPAGGSAAIAAPDGVAITGDVTIDGALSATGSISSDEDLSAAGNVSDSRSSMQAMRDVYNPHTHLLPGTPPTPSPAPTQKMT